LTLRQPTSSQLSTRHINVAGGTSFAKACAPSTAEARLEKSKRENSEVDLATIESSDASRPIAAPMAAAYALPLCPATSPPIPRPLQAVRSYDVAGLMRTKPRICAKTSGSVSRKRRRGALQKTRR